MASPLSKTNILSTNQTPTSLSTIYVTPPSTQQNIINLQQNLNNSMVQPSNQPTTINILPPNSSSTGTSPTVQLVQDPTTGLYNLVQSSLPPYCASLSTGATVTSLPQGQTPKVQPLQALCESPKRAGTPLCAVGSPLKVPKLLLPSLHSSKENTPSSDLNEGKFQCGVCNKYFGNQKNLRVHISEIHEGKRGEFPCDLCNKVFPRKRNMERHKNAIHLKNSPVCHMCHKSVVNLEMHIQRFHRGSTEIKIKLEETAPGT